MPQARLIHIGKRILNLDAVCFMDILSPHVIQVHVYEREKPLLFFDAEAESLMAVLKTGYVCEGLVEPEQSSDGSQNAHNQDE